MKTKAFAWIYAGLLLAAAGRAETLEEVRSRLATFQNDQPIKLVVDVNLQHKESAPLHREKVTERGTAKFSYGPDGVKALTQKWTTGRTHASIWTSGKAKGEDIPLLDFEEAEGIANPAGVLVDLLEGATLVEDSPAQWGGKTARLLVIRPAHTAAEPGGPAEGSGASGRSPFAGTVKLWLDENGVPLSMEGDLEVRFGPALRGTQHQTVIFQQIDGRLLAAEVQETIENTALGVMHGRDTRTLKVRVEARPLPRGGDRAL